MIKILSVILVAVLLTGCELKHRYCGKVTHKYTLNENNDGVYNIVFYNDRVKKLINVPVSSAMYNNVQKGDKVCFTLWDLYVGK
jgi:hypothetical protein